MVDWAYTPSINNNNNKTGPTQLTVLHTDITQLCFVLFCFVLSLVVVLSLRKAQSVESSDVLSTFLCGEYSFTASFIFPPSPFSHRSFYL